MLWSYLQFLGKEMTSAVTVYSSVKRRRFHLHCACGAITTGHEKMATCPDCGERITFRRKMYPQDWPSELLRSVSQELLIDFGGLVIFLLVWHLLGFAASVLMLGVLILVLIARTPPGPLSYHRALPDYQRRYRWFGRVALLFATSLAIGYVVVPGKTFREQATFLLTPEPHNCDWMSTPLGDKHCHYEPGFIHDNRGIAVEWHRVSD